MRYKTRFIAGIAVAFVVAILNGASLTAFIPLMNALGDKSKVFENQFTDQERKVLTKAAGIAMRKNPLLFLEIPKSPEKIPQNKAKEILSGLRNVRSEELGRLYALEYDLFIKQKLKINAAGYGPEKVVYSACLFIFPVYVLRLFLYLLCVRLIAKAGFQAVRDIREDLYTKAQRLPLSIFYKEKTGILMSRLINDAEIVSAVISSNLRDAVVNVFIILVNVIILFYLNATLLLWSIILVPIMLSPVTIFSRKIGKSTRRNQDLLAGLNGLLQEVISGIRVIRTFAREKEEINNFSTINNKLYWRTFKQEYYLKSGPNMVELTSSLVTIGIICLGVLHMHPTNFTSGDFIAFLLTLLVMIRPIIQLSGMFGKVVQSSAAGKRIFEILDMPPEVVDPSNPIPLQPMKRGIRFENVSFTYPETEKEVLTDINMKIEPGMIVALVGESGAGKSTIVDLISRFFEPTTGKITIDGNDIRDYRIQDHRSRIGIVQQEIFLFHGSVRENIAYGRPDIPLRQIIKAARLAHAHDFIRDLPEGYDTVLGERGLFLSGGQRQRIVIARVLLRDPEILILDEATSALDTESEKLIQHALQRVFQNRTTFVIAHRLSTIEQADLIVVVSEGRIVDLGTHDDLMKREGLYARLQEISRRTIVA